MDATRNHMTRRCIYSAAIMLLVGLVHQTSAAVLSTNYVQGQVADDSAFTQNVRTVDLSGSNPTVTLLVGQYFRFGVAGTVSSNPNPEVGSAWDSANFSLNGVSQPSQLGASELQAFKFNTPDGSTSVISPLTSTAAPFPRTTATINTVFDFRDKGDVDGSDIGSNFQVGGGSVVADPESSAGVAKLGAFTTTTNVFTNLRIQATGDGQTVLTSVIDPTGVYFWSRTAPGTVDAANNPVSDPVYQPRPFVSGGDTLNSLSPITFNVLPAPEPNAILFPLAVIAFGLLRRKNALPASSR